MDRHVTAQERARHFGQNPVSPFLVGLGREAIELGGGAVTGFARCGPYAVMASDPAAPRGVADTALDALLGQLRARRLWPVFAVVASPDPYERRGMHTWQIAEDACVELEKFNLSGSRMANVRHSVTSARRAGIRVEPYSPRYRRQVEQVSAAWLRGKGRRELGFTMSTFDPIAVASEDCLLALDAEGRVRGFVTWLSYDGGRGRALDLTRRDPNAPNPTMDLLIAESLLAFSAAGVERASLGAVVKPPPHWLDRFVGLRSLRRYKDKFGPRWVPGYAVVPSRRHKVTGSAALLRVCTKR